MSNIDKHAVQEVADLKAGYTLGHADVAILNELARIALASLELERGMIRRFDLDMSDCDSCGQDCGADMVEDLDGEYVLWDEVLPHLYRYDEYTSPPAPVSVPDEAIRSAVDEIMATYAGSEDECRKLVRKHIEDACRAAMLQGAENAEPPSGNSPVIPDGWVMVPEQPTHEMLEAGDEQFGTYDVYRRMISASPLQEVKP
ncbi:hypothetical protein [Enterobacter cloacae]|uniref:hypothetical protein n=1 Tax=Enterobacter cloacae TaxID=550 RepID=UPI00287531DF|nr:hypothetical protein [Enterobacter cloacae]MDS0062829.1 hypothetical protein [Enterobacter cloacae subsp. cloacae]MDS0105883.1 hypothetical protein [Enterobacter cloacae subsp. cloacae]MDW8494076.1 hypothetical protein [Enterobacter cloacae subsp. cloacae]